MVYDYGKEVCGSEKGLIVGRWQRDSETEEGGDSTNRGWMNFGFDEAKLLRCIFSSTSTLKR